MTRRRIATALAAAAVAATAAPAPAIDLGLGLFKRRKPNEPQAPAKSDPGLRVKQMVAAVESDPDVDHRKAAVTDLKTQDPRTNADIVPVLVGSLQKDPSPDVRVLAAEALGGYRTVYSSAAAALESVELNDPDKTVRAAAKAALWQYGLNGYRPSAPAVSSNSPEPPLARPVVQSKPTTGVAKAPAADATFRPITQGPIPTGRGKGNAFPQSDEPPLAKSVTPPATTQLPPPSVTVPQRMPSKLEVAEGKPPKPSGPAPSLPERKTTTTVTTPKPPAAAGVLPPPAEQDTAPPLPLPAIPTVLAAPTVKPPGK